MPYKSKAAKITLSPLQLDMLIKLSERTGRTLIYTRTKYRTGWIDDVPINRWAIEVLLDRQKPIIPTGNPEFKDIMRANRNWHEFFGDGMI